MERIRMKRINKERLAGKIGGEIKMRSG